MASLYPKLAALAFILAATPVLARTATPKANGKPADDLLHLNHADVHFLEQTIKARFEISARKHQLVEMFAKERRIRVLFKAWLEEKNDRGKGSKAPNRVPKEWTYVGVVDNFLNTPHGTLTINTTIPRDPNISFKNSVVRARVYLEKAENESRASMP